MTTVMSLFATELIFEILRYSDPLDIVQWRTVSKRFHAITCYPALWKVLYENSTIPRPPGPFPTQSSASLERMLVRAAQLMQSWTTRPMRAVSSITVKIGVPQFCTPIKLIVGRWLVLCKSSHQFVLHDVSPLADAHAPQVIWELETRTQLVSAWDVESVVSTEGQHIVYVLYELCKSSRLWKLLEFRLDVDTGKFYDATIVDPPPAVTNLHSAKLTAGKSQLLFIRTRPRGLLLDTQTRIFYQLPGFRESEYDPVTSEAERILRDTYFIVLYPADSNTLVHVFTLLPDDVPGENGQRVLCLTHTDVLDGRVLNATAMKPTIDLTTGTTNIRLIDHYSHRDELTLRCIDLTLPRHATIGTVPFVVEENEDYFWVRREHVWLCRHGALPKRTTIRILPISFKENWIRLPRERVFLRRYEAHCQYIDVSDDGYIRGFYRGAKRQKGKKRPLEVYDNQHVLKFAIDMTQAPWAVSRGEIGSAEWSEEDDPVDDSGRRVMFDGLRGRLCYRHPSEGDQIVIKDIL